MKKIEIVEHVINNTTISRSQAIQAVDCVFDAIENSLCRGESVYIRGFAHTSKRKKARNISKGTTVVIPAQRSAKLIISKQLKARMNL
jgi:DNA-binding protein HU-beta